MKNALLLLLCFFSIKIYGQAPTITSAIKLKSASWSDTVVYLALYKGNQLIVTDTIKIDSNGKGKIKDNFIVGEYEIVFGDRSQRPLIINEKSIRIKEKEGTLNYGASKENTLYDAFLSIQNKIDNRRKLLTKEIIDNRAKTEAELESLLTQRLLFTTKLSAQIETTLAGKIIKAICSPNDLLYYEQHIDIALYKKRELFKYCSLNDPSLFFSEVFHQKIKFYLTKVVDKNPELLINELTWMLETSKSVDYNYRYMVDYWLGFFQRNKKPTSELAFIHIVTEYVAKNETPWIEDYQIVRLKAHLDFFKNQKLGDKFPKIIAFDENAKPLNYELKRDKYQLIIFWDPNCSHCKVEIPEYFKVYQNFRDKGLSAVAFYDQLEKNDWLNFIKTNNLTWQNGADFDQKGNMKSALIITETPTVLLLNSEGIIINKRFKPSELKLFLRSKLL